MNFKDKDKLDSLRRRLYERDYKAKPLTRHSLSDDKKPTKIPKDETKNFTSDDTLLPPKTDSPRIYDEISRPKPKETPVEVVDASKKLPVQSSQVGDKSPSLAFDLKPKQSIKPSPPDNKLGTDAKPEADKKFDTIETVPATRKKKKKYRFWLLLSGLLFFALSMLAAVFFLFTGGNNIDGKNITIDISGPFAVRGGEEISVEVAISNQNPVSIESTILIIEYPLGSQSVDNPGREIFNERISLGTINPGETVTAPLKALIIGEESETKEIKVGVDYRVEGSNSTFYKDTEPFEFKISSSPIVLKIDGIKALSSGQEYETTLTVESNATTPLNNVLVGAKYPPGFDFSQSDPRPVSADNIWSIGNLNPGDKHTITIRGILIGEEKSEQVFTFSLGLANNRNPFILDSALTKISDLVLIEQPFLALGMTINRSHDEVVVIDAGERVSAEIEFTNNLSDTLFDTVIKVSLSGNALAERYVNVAGGFYDSRTNIITYDKNTKPDLEKIIPGAKEVISFSLSNLNNDGPTQQIDIGVDVSSERVFENNLSEELLGSIKRSVRLAGGVALRGSNEYYNSIFTNYGPIPPVAEMTTSYTIALAAESTTNNLTDAVVTATLPPYVDWLDIVRTGDSVIYNERDHSISWRIGQIKARNRATAAFQIAINPSQSQIGDTPVLVNRQQLKAIDKFTRTVVRASAPPISTEMPPEVGLDKHNGQVLREPGPDQARPEIDETGRLINRL